ncbi:MAG TPA: CarD family transcriptional regulator, partial [Sphaerochaeta sp.]|nr:CarD family transcriptional regulator [Sphaerochaeta sp.]
MNLSEKTLPFSVGEHVVYPLQGVGVITQIEEIDFRGIDTLYFVIYLDISDMTVR